jgi:hypothetical protein
MLEWPATQHISSSFFFFFLVFCFWIFFINYDGGILGKKKSKWSNCNNLKSLGGLSVTFETLKVKMQMDG